MPATGTVKSAIDTPGRDTATPGISLTGSWFPTGCVGGCVKDEDGWEDPRLNISAAMSVGDVSPFLLLLFNLDKSCDFRFSKCNLSIWNYLEKRVD